MNPRHFNWQRQWTSWSAARDLALMLARVGGRWRIQGARHLHHDDHTGQTFSWWEYNVVPAGPRHAR